jgi:UDP-N-acetylglucosamine--N-acetylmuramyl-(pentapeptide) pyrophosphoryl-undecaprenol N-acetylglucosamine transferase
MSSTAGGTTLLLASTGGHLSELHQLRHRFSPDLGHVEWATFDTPQARDMLAGETVHYVPVVRPKDARGTLRNMRVAQRLLRDRGITRVISTGAGVALPYFLAARRRDIPTHYIESAARTDGPSLTGRLVSATSRAHLYSQHTWGPDQRRWHFRGSVFDGFDTVGQTSPRIDKVVVTFGTQAGYSFHRAAAKLAKVLADVTSSDAEIVWQVGDTDVSGLGIDSVRSLSHTDMRDAIAEADLVVGHAGVGSSLLSLGLGRVPVLIPRMRMYGEHTDDHQQQIARDLERRGLAVAAQVAELTPEHLVRASKLRSFDVEAAPFSILDRLVDDQC